MSKGKSNIGGGGISFSSLLTIAFIVLKLTGYIDWSWWWVFSPLWVTFIVAFIVIFVVSLLVAITENNTK